MGLIFDNSQQLFQHRAQQLMRGCATCRGFSAVFASLGAFVVPMWIPLLGDIVLAFTAIIPGLPSACARDSQCFM
jgi:hypothetical protein